MGKGGGKEEEAIKLLFNYAQWLTRYKLFAWKNDLPKTGGGGR